MTPQIKQIVNYVAKSLENYNKIVTESKNRDVTNIDMKYRNTFFDKSLSHVSHH